MSPPESSSRVGVAHRCAGARQATGSASCPHSRRVSYCGAGRSFAPSKQVLVRDERNLTWTMWPSDAAPKPHTGQQANLKGSRSVFVNHGNTVPGLKSTSSTSNGSARSALPCMVRILTVEPPFRSTHLDLVVGIKVEASPVGSAERSLSRGRPSTSRDKVALRKQETTPEFEGTGLGFGVCSTGSTQTVDPTRFC
jgi:hypothetical protein